MGAMHKGMPTGNDLVIWGGITVLTGFIATALTVLLFASIRGCQQVQTCTVAYEVDSNTHLNNYAIVGLSTALSLELVSLHFSYESARPLLGLINGLDNTFLPPVLLCITLFVLILENMAFACSSTPWFALASADGLPVYTVIYVEWLINVPILLVLAGCCALDQSAEVVSKPLLVTNIYIIFAWIAHFIPNPIVRWSLVFVTFIMYGWASKDMLRWAQAYEANADSDAWGGHLRKASTYGLVVIFGAYGIVYLCRLTAVMTDDVEKVWYLCMNITTKLIMLMLFGGIRSSKYHDLIVNMLVNTHFSFRRQVAVIDGEQGNAEQELYKHLIE